MATLYADTIANVIGGPVWFYFTADLTPAVPGKIDDVIGMAGPYTPKTGWLLGGALTRSAAELAFSMTQAIVTTAHTNTPVATRVTQTNRTFKVPLQEESPAITQLAQDTPASVSIAVGAGGSGTPAQTAVPLGSVQRLTIRRAALIVERDPGVTGVFGESGTRGQFVAWLYPRVGLAASGSTQQLDPDTTSERVVEFQLFPESTISDPRKQHGFEVFESGLLVP